MAEPDHNTPKGSAPKSLLLGCVGVLMELSIVLGLMFVAGLKLGTAGLVSIPVICIPATVYYLWTRCSAENLQFISD